MEFVKKLVKNGSSLAINVPCDVLSEVGLSSGDTVKVNIDPITKDSKLKMAKKLLDDLINRDDMLGAVTTMLIDIGYR